MAVARDDRVPNIDTLAGETNWPQWKTQMRDYFEATELWDIVTGEETEPEAPGELAADANDAARNAHRERLNGIRAYRTRCARVKNILNQMVSKDLAHLLTRDGLDTPRQRWEALVANFDRPFLLSNQLQLMSRLLKTRMTSGMTVDQYFKEFQDVTQRLAALNAPVADNVQMGILLEGLSEEYEVQRASYIAKGEVTLTELHDALRNEEIRHTEAGNSSSSSVMFAGGWKGGAKKRNKIKVKGPPGSCWICGTMGHLQDDCPDGQAQESSGNQGKGQGGRKGRGGRKKRELGESG